MTSQAKIVESTLRKERGRLFNFIKKYVPSKEDAEDILQDVFYQFVAGFEDIMMIDRISNWLFKSARNR
ncbi:MAG: sigma factor, partial [Ignavibacteriaceae bacterium]